MRLGLTNFLLLLAAAMAAAQNTADDATLRKQALEMMREHQVVQAAPILEGLSHRHLDDMLVHEQLGMALLGEAAAAASLEDSKALRVRARAALQHAKDLGDNSDLLNSVLPNIPEDGSASAFSTSQQVEAEMREGENQFAHGDLRAAITHYQKAFELDPKLYYAALFTGDAFFKLHDYPNAAIWFNSAIAVNPDIETAHRYFADSLLAEKKFFEGRAQFIEAIIADPYNRRVWLGLNNLKDHVAGPVRRLHLTTMASVTHEGKNTNITLDDSIINKRNTLTDFWLAYGVGKAAWKDKHQNPSTDKRSTSLQEEASAYDSALSIVDEKDLALQKEHPELALLKQVQAAGLLEAWILIDQPDQEIARDYEPYRAANRDKIRRYLDEFAIPKVNWPNNIGHPERP